MEKRNLKISLKTAREWYNSHNEDLMNLAMKLYSVNELEALESYKTIDNIKDYLDSLSPKEREMAIEILIG